MLEDPSYEGRRRRYSADTARLARIDSLWRNSIKNYVDTGDPVFYGYSQGIDSDHWWFHLDEIASIPDDSFPVFYP